MQKHVDQLVEWLQKQVESAGMKGLMVGLSGGLDSSVVAYLIKKAFPNDSLSVILPCKSSATDESDAMKVVKASGIKNMTVDVTEAHDAIFSHVEKEIKELGDWKEENRRLGDANLRARLRMSTIYTIANNYNYLVVGTDNAAEWYTGYFTKFGDGGCDLLPLVHYTKREVRELAKILGVPDEIIVKKPSAGLWEGQTDEEEMGTTYDKIDDYLEGKEIPEKDKKIIERLYQRSEHKRKIPTMPPKFL